MVRIVRIFLIDKDLQSRFADDSFVYKSNDMFVTISEQSLKQNIMERFIPLLFLFIQDTTPDFSFSN